MKKRTGILRLLLAVALLCSLSAIASEPAGANVTAATVTPAPATAADTATYTVAFNVGGAGALTMGSTIGIVFPVETTLPASISKAHVSVNGTACTVDPAVSGQTVIIITPINVANGGGVNVTISQVAGITNSAIAKTAASGAYKVSVYTSTEPTAVQSNAYEILPSYSINPTSGDRFASITVTGKGWAPNSGISIGGGLNGAGTTDANGAFTLTASPYGNGGAVTITDGAGQTQAAPWVGTVTVPTFTMKSRIVVNPTSGKVGDTFAVSGYDFTSGGNISANSITMAGTALTHAAYALTTRDAYGTLDDCLIWLTVPATMTGGAKIVSVTDGMKTATATFTVATPTITIEPSSGQPGTMVTVTGANFRAMDTILIGGLDFGGSNWNTGVITIDAYGGWSYHIKVPLAAVAGDIPVVAISVSGTMASTFFTVLPRTLTLTPSSGPRGYQVTVSGSNMTPAGTIPVGDLTFAGSAWNTSPIPIDTLGNISPTTLRIPSYSPTGSNTVAATDNGFLTSSGTFTVTQPSIEISPYSGYRGDTVTVTGTGWVPGSLGIVTITFNAVTQEVAIPDANGEFTATFQIPLSAISGQLVGAHDGFGNSAPSRQFILLPASITVDPSQGPAGMEVYVTGAGFEPQTAVIALTIGGVNVLPGGPLMTDSRGAFTTSFIVPGLAIGAQVVSATVHSTTATTFFVVKEGAAPAVTTLPATGVALDAATLNGVLDDLGSASSVEVSFQWGLDTSYGSETVPQTMTATGSCSDDLSGLAPYTTYHFRAKAVGVGTVYGEDMMFFTFMPGDVDMDGDVDIFDWVKVRRIILGLEP